MDTTGVPGDGSVVGGSYAALTAEWHAQLRAYSQSMRLYQMLVRRQTERRRQWKREPEQPRLRPMTASPARIGATRPTARELAPVAATAPQAVDGPSPTVLTRRQLEVARLIAEGLTNDQIARRLVLTSGTVGNHVEHILRRLGMRNRAQVAAWMTRRAGQ